MLHIADQALVREARSEAGRCFGGRCLDMGGGLSAGAKAVATPSNTA
jgi:hypothetical protein